MKALGGKKSEERKTKHNGGSQNLSLMVASFNPSKG